MTAEDGEPAVAMVQENELTAEAPISESVVEMPTAVDSAPAPAQSPVVSPTVLAQVPSSAPQSAPIQDRPRATSGWYQQPRPKEPAVMIDEDGFEMKVRRQPKQAFRGRGGRANGMGDRGGGGPGRGRGGRGGVGAGPQGGPRPLRTDAPPTPIPQQGQQRSQRS